MMLFFVKSLQTFLFLEWSGLLLAVNNAQCFDSVFWCQIYAIIFSKSIWCLCKLIRNNIRRCSKRRFKWACYRRPLSVDIFILHFLNLGRVLGVPLTDVVVHLLTHLLLKFLSLLIQILTDRQSRWRVIAVHRMVHRQVIVNLIIALDNQGLRHLWHR